MHVGTIARVGRLDDCDAVAPLIHFHEVGHLPQLPVLLIVLDQVPAGEANLSLGLGRRREGVVGRGRRALGVPASKVLIQGQGSLRYRVRRHRLASLVHSLQNLIPLLPQLL